MPDLTNKASGVTVSVSEAVARALGTQWQSPVEAEPEKKPSKRTRKTS